MADQQRPKNPFIHSHDHGHHHHGHGHDHHHHHDDETIDEFDPAQQSLSDALRVSFNILKIIMFVLFVVYCCTGIFSVDASQVAVRLRFGKIVGEPGNQIKGPGWHSGLPYPIEQKIYVPVATQRTVVISRTFWPQERPEDAGKSLDERSPLPSLNPETSGSLLTGEANIVHAQFEIRYRITDPILWVTNVGEADPRDARFHGAAAVPYDPLANADALVRAAAEEGIVAAVARTDTDSVLKKLKIAGIIRKHAQDVLDEMKTGITITGDPNDPESANGVIVNNPTMPYAVRPAYYAGNNAESERAQKVAEANSERTTTLNAAAGPGHDGLAKLIQQYEYQHAAGDEEQAQQTRQLLNHAFDQLAIDNQAIGGEVARIINTAKTYRTTIVEQVKSEANTFNSLLAEYRKNPALQRARLWLETREAIFAGDVETFYTDGEPYLVLNRDPQVQRRREQERIRQAQEAGTAPQR